MMRVDKSGEGENRPPARAVKLLLPIWGHRHVSQWLEFSLPTLLASGNIPALASTLPCEFVLMTRQEDLEIIRAHALWARLASICSINVRLIDDIIVERNHHVTITLAYADAVRSAGKDICDTCFIFLVSDCLFANGSLAYVLSCLQSGANGVVTGHIQTSAEDLAVALRKNINPSRLEIALTSRQLMALALTGIHSISSTDVTNGQIAGGRINRLFWRVDANTLIGRFYLMHMIGIRPETDDFVVAASCDYSFIPEMCPSGNVTVVTDSDDYLAVEMQPHDREPSACHSTFIQPRQVAWTLSEWTTAAHRQNAHHTLIFHAADIPANTGHIKSDADALITSIDGHLSRKPQPYRHHPSWIAALAAYRAAKGGEGRSTWQRVPKRIGFSAALLERLWNFRLSAFGQPPNVRPWHPRWPDFWLPLKTLRPLLRRSRRLVLISNTPAVFSRWLKKVSAEIVTLDISSLGNNTQRIGSIEPAGFDICLMILERDQFANAGRLLQGMRVLLRPGGLIAVVLTNDTDDAFNRQGLDLPPLISTNLLSGAGLQVQMERYIGESRLRRAIQDMMVSLARTVRMRPWFALPVAPLGVPLILASVLCNCAALLNVARVRPQSLCSSFFTLMSIPEPAT